MPNTLVYFAKDGDFPIWSKIPAHSESLSLRAGAWEIWERSSHTHIHCDAVGMRVHMDKKNFIITLSVSENFYNRFNRWIHSQMHEYWEEQAEEENEVNAQFIWQNKYV